MPFDRRRFLLASAASSLACRAATSKADEARSANQRLRIAILGWGGYAREFAPAFESEEIVAVCDADRGALEFAGERFPQARGFADFREALRMPDLDAAAIFLPDHVHLHAIVEGLAAKLHVWAEKPVVAAWSELATAVAWAAASDRTTQVGIQHHFDPGYAQAVDWLSRLPGAVTAVDVWTDRPFWPQGNIPAGEALRPPAELDWQLWLGPLPTMPYRAEIHPVNWRGWRAIGSGALGDMGPHLLDPVWHGLGKPDFDRIDVAIEPGSRERFPEWSELTYRVQETTDRPGFLLRWYDGGRIPPVERTGIQRLPRNGALVYGEWGKVFLPGFGEAPRAIGFDPPSPTDGPAPETAVEHFLAAAKAGRKSAVSIEATAGLARWHLLGNAAVLSGRSVGWDAKTGRVLHDASATPYLCRAYREGWELPAAGEASHS